MLNFKVLYTSCSMMEVEPGELADQTTTTPKWKELAPKRF